MLFASLRPAHTHVRGNDRTANVYAYVYLHATHIHAHTITPIAKQIIHGIIPTLSFECVSCFEVRYYDILVPIGLNKQICDYFKTGFKLLYELKWT